MAPEFQSRLEKPQVAEDGGDDGGIEDKGRDARLGAAARAAKGVDLEDAPT